MVKYSLHIDCEDVSELADIVNKMAANLPAAAPAELASRLFVQEDDTFIISQEDGSVTKIRPEAPAVTAQDDDAFKKSIEVAAAKRARKPVLLPAKEAPQPAPEAAKEAPQPAPEAAKEAPQPAPDPAPGQPRAITIADARAALSKFMDVKGAKAAQEVLQKSVGCGSISSTPPEKYGAAIAALNAALEA